MTPNIEKLLKDADLQLYKPGHITAENGEKLLAIVKRMMEGLLKCQTMEVRYDGDLEARTTLAYVQTTAQQTLSDCESIAAGKGE